MLTPTPAKQPQALPERLNLRPERNVLPRQLPQLFDSRVGGGASSGAGSKEKWSQLLKRVITVHVLFQLLHASIEMQNVFRQFAGRGRSLVER